jgi:thioredoxin-related protein
MQNPNTTTFRAFLTCILLGIITKSIAQVEVVTTINWLNFKQVNELSKKSPKPLLIFYYSDKNDSSKVMLNQTFAHKEVVTLINQRFYAVKINATSKSEIWFTDNKTYKKNPKKQYGDFIYKALGNTPVFPALQLINEQGKTFTFNGFNDKYNLICKLMYVAEKVNRTTKFEAWEADYFRTFKPGEHSYKAPFAIHWMTLEQALRLNKEKPKGIFLTFYLKNNAASAVLLVNALSNNTIADYMNTNFYCVRIDAQTTDTLVWDKKYINSRGEGNFHDLPLKLMKGGLQFPSSFFFDSVNKLVLSQDVYLTPDAFYPLAKYVGNGEYTKMKFADYLKTYSGQMQFKPEPAILPDDKSKK